METIEISQTQTVYDQILKLFTLKLERYPLSKSFLINPFIVNNLVCSSDRFSALFFNKNLAGGSYSTLDGEYKADVLKVINVDKNRNIALDFNKLKELVDFCPSQVQKTVKNEKVVCSACGGEREVEFTFRHDGNRYTEDCTCPVCEGSGNVTQTTVTPDESEYIPIKILGACFSANELNRVLQVATILQTDDLTLTYVPQTLNGYLFKVQQVEILVMPITASENQIASVLI